jgi:hypothetical protein
MTCDCYKKHELNEMDESEFQAHLRECPVCQKIAGKDTELLNLARSLNQKVRAPLLWTRIENQIRQEKSAQSTTGEMADRRAWTSLWRIAAAVLITFGLTLAGYFLSKPGDIESHNLLAGEALRQVEKAEQEYVTTIDRLETAAMPQMLEMDTELTLLYRDRLAIIDTQILHCREALAENPRNAHIRRYLLLALQDKKKTLSEILDIEPPVL